MPLPKGHRVPLPQVVRKIPGVLRCQNGRYQSGSLQKSFLQKKKINWLALVFSENLNILRRHRAEIEEFYRHLVVENLVKFHTVGRNFSFMFGRAVS